jgi:NADPH:quinone reductase-like Zn-dependent oxidoreductase
VRRRWELSEPTGPRGLTLVERDTPTPGPSDVVMRVRAVSLNARDLSMVSGTYLRKTPTGMVPCSDAAGEVVAVGAQVMRVKPGDRVMSMFAPGWQCGQFSLAAARSALGAGTTTGTLAEAISLPEHGVIEVPAHLSFEEASTFTCAGLTAWHALFEDASLTPGSAVLTLGTGGVSVFAVQFALQAGARVIATSSHDAKLERLKRMGVHDVVNYRTEPNWGDRVRELTGGLGVDNVIEVGGHGTLDQSIRAVRLGGTISLIGVLSGPGAVNLVPVLMRNIRVQGVMVGSREMYQRMLTAISLSQLKPVVDRVFSFGEAPAAFEHLASGVHFGKVVISV